MPAKLPKQSFKPSRAPLMRLPSGTWINPDLVDWVQPQCASGNIPDCVVVMYGGYADRCECSSYTFAVAVAEEIAVEVNQRRIRS
jgi:hypothetical protein